MQSRQDYERIDSPVPSYVNKQQSPSGGAPFKISLLEMPIDPGSAEKVAHDREREQNTQDFRSNNEGHHPLSWNKKS